LRTILAHVMQHRDDALIVCGYAKHYAQWVQHIGLSALVFLSGVRLGSDGDGAFECAHYCPQWDQVRCNASNDNMPWSAG
jgi:hypothetical protein